MNRLKSNNGFTLAELVVVVGILSVVITGLLQLFIYTSVQAEISGNSTLAISEAQDKMEEIRNHNYDTIVADYASSGTPGNTFDLSLLTGKGVVYIDSSNAELLVVEVVVCWKNKYNRILGEDLDLDGVLDAGEDTNGDLEISSPVKLISMITRR